MASPDLTEWVVPPPSPGLSESSKWEVPPGVESLILDERCNETDTDVWVRVPKLAVRSVEYTTHDLYRCTHPTAGEPFVTNVTCFRVVDFITFTVT